MLTESEFGMKLIGSNNNDLMEMNRSTIVKILQGREFCSRAELSRLTGLTQAAITKIITALMDMGIVSETGMIKGSGNRRSIGIKLNAEKYKVVGVKFSRRLFSVGVFDISGKIYYQSESVCPEEETAENVIEYLKKMIREAISKFEQVIAIGLAVPGPYLRKEGRIALVTSRPTWHNINFIEAFQNEFSIPFFIEHDARAGALASWWFDGKSNEASTLAYFFVGEGVGAGIIERGSLQVGAAGASSEIGHISIDVNGERCECGNYGCLELYCSELAVSRLARKKAPECFSGESRGIKEDCDLIFEAARKGNPKAISVMKEIAEYIGYGCVNLMNAYNPDIIVIGDSISKADELILPTIQKVVRERVFAELSEKVEIKISESDIDPTLWGAAAAATDQVLKSPSKYLAVV